MAIRFNHNKFLADFSFDKKRYRRQFDTEVEATAWEAEMRRRLKLKLNYGDLLETKDAYISFGKCAEKCFDRHWAGTKNESQCIVNMKILESFFGSHTPIQEIDANKIDDFVGFLRRKGRAPATINQKLATLGKIVRFAEERGFINKRPAMARVKQPNNSRRRFLSESEEGRILGFLNENGMRCFARWMEWSIDTGMRPEETRNVRMEDVRQDPDLGWVVDVNEYKDTAGTTDPRTIPLTDRAYDALIEQQGSRGNYPWIHANNKRRQKFWDQIRVEFKEDDPDFVPYMCRHTCATRLVQRNVNIKAVQHWMGHKTLDMTMKYVKLSPKELWDARNSLNQ